MTKVTVDLGRIGREPLRGDDRQGQALYLTNRDMLVVVDGSTERGWRASRVLWGEQGDGDRHVFLTGDDLMRAVTEVDIDVTAQPDRYVALWLLRIWQQIGSRAWDVARGLVTWTREPASQVLRLDSASLQKLYGTGHVTNFGVNRHITRLVTEGFLARLPGAASEPARYLLTIPGFASTTGNA